jgi:hypothetical protein
MYQTIRKPTAVMAFLVSMPTGTILAQGQPEEWKPPAYVTPAEKILAKIKPFSPSVEKGLPEDFAARIGVTHVSGKYHLTDEPFLLEGAKLIHRLGYQRLKLWFDPNKIQIAYPFNSDWSALGDKPRLVEMARHPYYDKAFALPFETIVLEVYPIDPPDPERPEGKYLDLSSDFREDEEQVRELADYLMKKFKDRQVTFILQNWEGDWMLRDNARKEWLKGDYPDLEKRVAGFARWFQARQNGVDRARQDNPDSKCRVLHAVEANRVMDSWHDIPTITSHVLPRINPDMFSWSCYDGLARGKKSFEASAVGIYRGWETIQHYARQRPGGGEIPVIIGEVGLPEQQAKLDAEDVAAIYGGALASSMVLDLDGFYIWQVYCNEIEDGIPKDKGVYTAGELRGYWLLRPDGSPSLTSEYFSRLMSGTSRPGNEDSPD